MAKKRVEQGPPVRKSFLIVAGAAIGAALIGFVLMTFVFGGGGGEDDTGTVATETSAPGAEGAPAAPIATPVPTPKPTDPPGLKPGGRDPFSPIGGAPQAAAAPAVVKPASIKNDEVKISVVKVYGEAADLKFGTFALEGVKAGQVLSPRFDVDEVKDACVFFKDDGERFKVCEGKSAKR